MSATDGDQLSTPTKPRSEQNGTSPNRQHSAVSPRNNNTLAFSGCTASNLLERIAQQLNSKYIGGNNALSTPSSAIRDLLVTENGANGTNQLTSLSATVQSMLSDGSDSSSASPAQLEVTNEEAHTHAGIPWPVAPQISQAVTKGDHNVKSANMPDERTSVDLVSLHNPVKNEIEENRSPISKLSPRAISDENNNIQAANSVQHHHKLNNAELEEIDAFARPGPNYQVVDTSKLPPVYSFFTRTFVANTGEIKAYCGSCRKHIASHKGDVTRTSNLIRHLKNMHPELHHEFQSTRSRYCRKKEPITDHDVTETNSNGSVTHHSAAPPPERSRVRKTMRLDSINSTTSNSTPSSTHDVIGSTSSSHSTSNFSNSGSNSRKISQLYRQQSANNGDHPSSIMSALDPLNMLSMAPPSISEFHQRRNNNSLRLLAGGGVGSSTSSSSLPHSSQNSPHNNINNSLVSNGSAALLLAAGFGGMMASAKANGASSNGSSDVDVMLLDENDADVEKQHRKRGGDTDANASALNQSNTNAVHNALASMLVLGSAQQQQDDSPGAATSPAARAALSAAAAVSFGDSGNRATAPDGGAGINDNFAQRSAHIMQALGLTANRNGVQRMTNESAMSPPLSVGGHHNMSAVSSLVNNHINNPQSGMNGQFAGIGPNALLSLARNVFSSTTFGAGSLIGVPALINPQLLYIMAKMGAGDELLFVPQNFATSTYATRNKIDAVFLNGLSLFIILEAVLRILPIDVESGAPVMLPQAAQNANFVPTLAPILQAAIMRNYTDYPRHRPIFNFSPSREHLLSVAKETACAVVQTGERSDSMFMLVRKGSIMAADKSLS